MSELSERIEVLRREVGANPGSRQFYQLGELLRRDGNAAEAVEVLVRGLASNPRYVAAWVSLGRARIDAGEAKGAAEALREAIGLDPANPVAWRLLGEARMAQGAQEGALSAFEHALQLAPGDAALEATVDGLRAAAEREALDAAQLFVAEPEAPAPVPAEPEVPAAVPAPPEPAAEALAPMPAAEAQEPPPLADATPFEPPTSDTVPHELQVAGVEPFSESPLESDFTEAPEAPYRVGETVHEAPAEPFLAAPPPAPPEAGAEAFASPPPAAAAPPTPEFATPPAAGAVGDPFALAAAPAAGLAEAADVFALVFPVAPAELAAPAAAPLDEVFGAAARAPESAGGPGPFEFGAPSEALAPGAEAFAAPPAAAPEPVWAGEPAAIPPVEPEPAEEAFAAAAAAPAAPPLEAEAPPEEAPAPQLSASAPAEALEPQPTAAAPLPGPATVTMARLYIQNQELGEAAAVLERVLAAQPAHQEARDLLELVQDMMEPLPASLPPLSRRERRIASLQRWLASLTLAHGRTAG